MSKSILTNAFVPCVQENKAVALKYDPEEEEETVAKDSPERG